MTSGRFDIQFYLLSNDRMAKCEESHEKETQRVNLNFKRRRLIFWLLIGKHSLAFSTHLNSQSLHAKQTSCSMIKPNSCSFSWGMTKGAGDNMLLKLSSEFRDRISVDLSLALSNLVESVFFKLVLVIECWRTRSAEKNLQSLSRTCLEISWARGNFIPHRPQLKIMKTYLFI